MISFVSLLLAFAIGISGYNERFDSRVLRTGRSEPTVGVDTPACEKIIESYSLSTSTFESWDDQELMKEVHGRVAFKKSKVTLANWQCYCCMVDEFAYTNKARRDVITVKRRGMYDLRVELHMIGLIEYTINLMVNGEIWRSCNIGTTRSCGYMKSKCTMGGLIYLESNTDVAIDISMLEVAGHKPFSVALLLDHSSFQLHRLE